MAKSDDHTSVRVALRVRPQLPKEIIQASRVCTFVSPTEPQVTLGKDAMYTYDYIFDTITKQEDVYSTCVESLVEGCFDGFNATILAYGQTGSGKTYTMGTGFDVSTTPEELGVVPRAVEHIFNGIHKRRREAKAEGLPPPEFVVSTQFMELYNEEIIDLLNNNNPNRNSKSNIRIHEDANKNVFVVGVTTKDVNSAEETMKCLQMGALKRTTASTQMNNESSRSHAIFTIHLKQTRVVRSNNNKENIPENDIKEENEVNSETDNNQDGVVNAKELQDLETEILTAKFHFTDLAGSERIKRTGAVGQRAKEGISINCGLLALGKVISALGDPAKDGSHVPYRDSKLTRLLEDSLGGNSRTMMIACISPSDVDFIETKSTLRYANCVRNIKNKVVANQDKASKQLNLLKQQIAALKLELTEYKMGKRVAGSESFNDMYQENALLQEENNHLRMRVRAMQETIDSQSTRLTQEATKNLRIKSSSGEEAGDGENEEDVADIVGNYVKEIEQLRARLVESEAICENLRRKSVTNTPMSPFVGRVTRLNHTPIPMSVSNDFEFGNVNEEDEDEIIEEAKKDLTMLMNKKDLLDEKAHQKTIHEKPGENKEDTDTEGTTQNPEDDNDKDVDESEVFGEDEDLNDDSSDDDAELDLTDDEDAEEDNAEAAKIQDDIAAISCEIDIKQRLIMQLESQQQKFYSMQSQYEHKLKQLTFKIKTTEEERDKVLSTIVKKPNNSKINEETQKVKVQFQKKIESMQKQMSALQQAKKKHDILVRKQSKNQTELDRLKSDLDNMKKTRVRLMSQMREDQKRNKAKDSLRQREINALKKEQRKRENKIRNLESQNRTKEAQMRRKQEEIVTLRRQLKPISGNFGKKKREAVNLSKIKAAEKRKKSSELNMKMVRKKWLTVEKKINDVITQRETASQIERQMERLMKQREDLQENINKLQKKRLKWRGLMKPQSEIDDLEIMLSSYKENIEFVSTQIQDCQSEVIEVEKGLEDSDMASLLENCSVDELKYLMNQFVAMTVSKATLALQAQNKVTEVQANLDNHLNSSKQTEELMRYMLRDRQEVDPHLADIIGAVFNLDKDISVESESESSRESSPERNDTGTIAISKAVKDKARRRTAMPEDLLYGINSSNKPVISVTGNLTNGVADSLNLNGTFTVEKPSTVAKQLFDVENNNSDKVSPNSTFIIESNTHTPDKRSPSPLVMNSLPQSTPIAPTEDKINKSNKEFQEPTGIPLTARSNVFSRLTTYSLSSPRNDNLSESETDDLDVEARGRINSYSAKVQSSRSAPLVCTQVAEGHHKAVLSIQATDHLLFSGSKDRSCKVWNLVTGQEIMSLDGHPNNVHALQYCPVSNLLYSVSLCYIKVWDIRSKPKCIKVLSSSGQVLSSSNFTGTMTRTNRMPNQENFIFDIAVSKQTGMLLSASGKDVKIWDSNKHGVVANLTGHTGHIMTMAIPDSPKPVVITGSKDHYIKMYDLPSECSGNITPTVALDPPHMDGVEALTVSTKSNVLFSGSRDKSFKKWSLDKRACIKTEYQAHPNWVCALDIVQQPDDGDELLVSGGRGGMLKLWDVESVGSMGEIRAHHGAINDLATNKDRIFTASNDKSIRIWRLND